MYHLVMTNSLPWKIPTINGGLMGKSSINGPFSMAMLNNQRVNGSNFRSNLANWTSNSASFFALILDVIFPASNLNRTCAHEWQKIPFCTGLGSGIESHHIWWLLIHGFSERSGALGSVSFDMSVRNPQQTGRLLEEGNGSAMEDAVFKVDEETL